MLSLPLFSLFVLSSVLLCVSPFFSCAKHCVSLFLISVSVGVAVGAFIVCYFVFLHVSLSVFNKNHIVAHHSGICVLNQHEKWSFNMPVMESLEMKRERESNAVKNSNHETFHQVLSRWKMITLRHDVQRWYFIEWLNTDDTWTSGVRGTDTINLHNGILIAMIRFTVEWRSGIWFVCFYNKTQALVTKKCKWNIFMMSFPRVF